MSDKKYLYSRIEAYYETDSMTYKLKEKHMEELFWIHNKSSHLNHFIDLHGLFVQFARKRVIDRLDIVQFELDHGRI